MPCGDPRRKAMSVALSLRKRESQQTTPSSAAADTARAVLAAVRASGRNALTAPEAKVVCDAYDIPLPREALSASADSAAKLAAKIGFPVVMKIVSADILHKTDAGGVIVGVKSAEEARKAYDTIIANARRYKADAKIDGVQVQQMLPSGATETLIGAM